MTAIVYTAIAGGYDELKQPVPQKADSRFVCFAEVEAPRKVGAWEVVPLKADPAHHPRMRAKRPKLMSHELFPDGRWKSPLAFWPFAKTFDLSIWVDGSLEIFSADFVGDMRASLGEADWAMFVHPDRDCIYEEAELSYSLPKYRDQPVREQVEAYREMVPAHDGLFACGIIVRREPVSEKLRAAEQAWWAENLKWTYQDQLSLPYVFNTLPETRPKRIEASLRSNDWFRIRKHAHMN